MRYDVLGQLTGPQGHARLTVEAPVPPGTGCEWVGPLHGVVTLEKAGEHFLATGWLEARARLDCGRCTQPHEITIRVDLAETVALQQTDEPSAYREDAGDAPLPILSGDQIDLSELARQVLVLAIPPRSLCSSDCRGLCPQCGQDLNEEQCDCDTDRTDPRLEALRDLL
jgi:uncharacterized protein